MDILCGVHIWIAGVMDKVEDERKKADKPGKILECKWHGFNMPVDGGARSAHERALSTRNRSYIRRYYRDATAQDWANWQFQGQDGQEAISPISEGLGDSHAMVCMYGSYVRLFRRGSFEEGVLKREF